MRNKKIFIFILCPPFQGSTLLVNLLDSSKKTASFVGKCWAGEFQSLLKKNGDRKYDKNRWNPDYDLDMNLVKNIFDNYLDNSKNIFVEKSPPTICRAKMFEEYFEQFGDVWFIISIRNPYSSRWHNDCNWIKCANYQRRNIKNLKNTIVTSYEELCTNLNVVINKIQTNIPELNDIKNKRNSKLYGERGKKINSSKIGRMIKKHKKNKLLKNNIRLVNYFNYDFVN